MKDIQALVSAVIKHAEARPDTIWDTVYDTYTRQDIAEVVKLARTPKDAVRLMKSHLEQARELVLA